MGNLESVLWYLLGGTRGGPLRARILRLLRERPLNRNQLAKRLDVDYKTVQHHLEVMNENKVVHSSGDEYGAVYLPTPAMRDSWDTFETIVDQLDDLEDDPLPGDDDAPGGSD
jgi:DNA-binding transcriptional ArsR family regulator